MTKAAPKLTKVQAKALEFIKSTIERSGTSPTLRELCAYMGYSAIGSAQDLVAALRRKGFLLIPDKQSARSLILTPKAIAMHEPTHQSTDTTYVVHCVQTVPDGKSPLEAIDERTGTLRMSVAMFDRPYPSPETLYSLQAPDDSMIDVGIFKNDWLVVNYQTEAEPGQIVVAKIDDKIQIKTLMKDRLGWYLKPENTSYHIVRCENADGSTNIVGRVIALQRVF